MTSFHSLFGLIVSLFYADGYYITGSCEEERTQKARPELYIYARTLLATLEETNASITELIVQAYILQQPDLMLRTFSSIRGSILRSSSAPVANQTEGKSPTSFWRSHVLS